MRGLAGKRVLICGGTSGIGLASAERFVAEGCSVVTGGLPSDTANAAATLEPLGASVLPVDVTSEESVIEFVDGAVNRLGGIDVLCNNAGMADEQPFLETSTEVFDATIAVNLRGMFLVGRHCARVMARQGRGVIINMCSTNGLAGEWGYAAYDASKGGVALLTRSMAIDLGPQGIRVNAIAPGYIETPLSQSIDDDEFVEAYVADKIPLRRTGSVDDVAGAYAFLASDDALFVHGAILVVDGGQLA